MPTILKTKNSVTTTVVPTTLQQGELAVNITDKKMWVGNAATTPVQIVGTGSGGGGAAGSNTQVQFNSSGALAGSANLTFNGTTLVANDITDSSLTSGRVTYAGTGGNLTDSANFTFNGTGILIGTTSSFTPSSLDINPTSGNPNITLRESNAFRGYIEGNSSGMLFGTGPAATERMRIDSNGNVGIGTSSPSTYGKFAVVGSSGSVETYVVNNGTTVQAAMWTQNNSGLKTGIFHYGSAQSAYGAIGSGEGALYSTNNLTIMCDVAGGVIKFATGGNTERMRITSGGNVLVGKSADNDTTLGVRVTSGIVNSAGSTDFWNSYSTTAGVYRFYVTNGGTVTATNTTISAISDQRFKENIVDLDVGIDAVMALKPRKFDWKEGKGKNIKGDRGFIAQEFEQVFPDLIDEWKDPAPEGEEPYKAVRQDLIPILVKAIQEQQTLIENLTTRLNALEGK
jgi:hypothetical protein